MISGCASTLPSIQDVLPSGGLRPPTGEPLARRRLIGFYERYARTLFERYGDRVTYWLTFNEINAITMAPLMAGGIWTPKEQLTTKDLYQAIHHELVASASVTRIAHEINPALKVGCMILSMPAYPLTPDPADV